MICMDTSTRSTTESSVLEITRLGSAFRAQARTLQLPAPSFRKASEGNIRRAKETEREIPSTANLMQTYRRNLAKCKMDLAWTNDRIKCHFPSGLCIISESSTLFSVLFFSSAGSSEEFSFHPAPPSSPPSSADLQTLVAQTTSIAEVQKELTETPPVVAEQNVYVESAKESSLMLDWLEMLF